jgi:hypothetical protein
MQDSFAVGISLPKYMIKKIDTERGDIPRSRYVLRILEKMYIPGIKKDDNVKSRRNLDPLGRRAGSLLQSSESMSI